VRRLCRCWQRARRR